MDSKSSLKELLKRMLPEKLVLYLINKKNGISGAK